MTPVAKAAEMCHKDGGNFLEQLEEFLLTGFVLSAPDAFLMGRAVPYGCEITGDFRQTWPEDECNAWFVWWGVGSAERLLALMPYELPWVGFVRHGREWPEVHWIPTAYLRKRLKRACKG